MSLSDITQTARLIGTIKAKRSTVLAAKSTGTLDYLVQAGQKVSKGSLIARLENSELENVYTILKDAVKIAKDRYHRLLTLEKSNAASKHAVEERKNQWIEPEKALSDAKIELDKTHFTAPFEGIVGAYKILEGSQVQEGDPIVTFYDPSEVIVEFDIPAPLLSQIEDGKIAIINKKQYRISHVQKMIDPDTWSCPIYRTRVDEKIQLFTLLLTGCYYPVNE
jgi:membrane fusion protein (multidrug efflux system)